MSKHSPHQSARLMGLRFSLLASLGLLPIACGGTFQNGGEDGGSGNGGSGNGGSSEGGSNSAGTGTTKGGSSKGGTTAHAGSTSKAGSANNAGTGSGGGSTKPACTNPQVDSGGLVLCDEGYAHRPAPMLCSPIQIEPQPAQGGAPGAGIPLPIMPRVTEYVPCADDPSKCGIYQYGFCDNRGEIAAPGCASGCVSDQDCGAGNICVCGHDESPTGGVCQVSDCKQDSDCGEGYCATYAGVCGGGGFACQRTTDECVSNADCLGGTCYFESTTAHRACNNAVCGRPFLVEAAPRLAPVVSGGAWREAAPLVPQLAHLTADERSALAAHWTRMGQMEHASIAAFARFSLQLLSLGAPPALVEACTRALGDETAHTKLCFELASAYAGHAIGPGPLDVAGSLELTSLADIVDLVIAEGCFGETGAALDALEAADQASDAVIVAAYQRIAADEQRHAELAFQFVRWALERDPSSVRPRVLAARQRDGATHAAAREVVLPCFDALLAHPGGGSIELKKAVKAGIALAD